jgi:hypothetical protein
MKQEIPPLYTLQWVKGKNLCRSLSKIPMRGGCQWLTAIILATQEAEIRRIKGQSQPGQIVDETLSRKHPTPIKKVGGVAQEVQRLPSKCEALSSNHSTEKKE